MEPYSFNCLIQCSGQLPPNGMIQCSAWISVFRTGLTQGRDNGPPVIAWPRLAEGFGGHLGHVACTTCPGRNALSKPSQTLSGGVKVKGHQFFSSCWIQARYLLKGQILGSKKPDSTSELPNSFPHYLLSFQYSTATLSHCLSNLINICQCLQPKTLS